MEALIARWGYLAIASGTFLEGETVLVAGGALAHKGLLSLPLVIAAGFAGSVAGDLLWFHLGRRFGSRLLLRRPQWRDRADRFGGWFLRNGPIAIIGFRFVYGIRTVAPAVLGASGYSSRRFALLNLIGGAAWAAAVGALGWALGAGLESLLDRVGETEELVVAALAVTAVLALIARRWSKRRASQPRR